MTLPENTKGVLLDVDDTLVDTRGAFAHAMGAIADEYFPHLPGERHGDVLAMWRADRNGFYRAYTQGRLSEQQQRRARAEELHAAFGGPMITDRLYAEWEELFMVAFAAGWAPFPEVDAVLADFSERGLAVGAVTNANQSMQTRKLRACGLDDVPLLVTLDTFGVGKPDPACSSRQPACLDFRRRTQCMSATNLISMRMVRSEQVLLGCGLTAQGPGEAGHTLKDVTVRWRWGSRSLRP